MIETAPPSGRQGQHRLNAGVLSVLYLAQVGERRFMNKVAQFAEPRRKMFEGK